MFQLDLYYTLASPPSRAVIILSRLLKIDVNLIEVKLMEGEHQSAKFVKINPRKVVPALNDNGFLVAESRVIMTYLINKYKPGNKLYPSDARARAQVDRMLYLTAEVFQRGRAIINYVFADKSAMAIIPDDLKASYLELLAVVDQLIGDQKFLIGDDLTIADISLICDIGFFTDAFLIDISSCTNVNRWRNTAREELTKQLGEGAVKELLDDAIKGFSGMVHVKIGAKVVCPGMKPGFPN